LLDASKEEIVSDYSSVRPLAVELGLPRRLGRAVTERLQGPGGYYNIGNVLGLVGSVATQLAIGAATGTGQSGLDILIGYFAGSPAAVALTGATLIFLVSGELYHRAWAGRTVPDAALNQFADALSAVGGLLLTLGLVFVGHWVLAIPSGLLVIGGKLGSALFVDDSAMFDIWPKEWVDPFRGAVLAGRVPAFAAAVLDLGGHLFRSSELGAFAPVQPAILVVCYMLWIRADYLLVAGARATVRQNEEATDAHSH
jgi:hypothetical protein